MPEPGGDAAPPRGRTGPAAPRRCACPRSLEASRPCRAARPGLTRRKRRSVSRTATPKGPRSTKALMAAAASGCSQGRPCPEVRRDLVRQLHLTHRRGLPGAGGSCHVTWPFDFPATGKTCQGVPGRPTAPRWSVHVDRRSRAGDLPARRLPARVSGQPSPGAAKTGPPPASSGPYWPECASDGEGDVPIAVVSISNHTVLPESPSTSVPHSVESESISDQPPATDGQTLARRRHRQARIAVGHRDTEARAVKGEHQLEGRAGMAYPVADQLGHEQADGVIEGGNSPLRQR